MSSPFGESSPFEQPSPFAASEPSPFEPPRRRSRGMGLVIAAISVMLTALPLALVLAVIWPGVLTLFSPLLCSSDLPDAFVVVDTFQVRPGETDFVFTMYCVGPTGAVDDVGWFRPMALLTVTVAVIVFVITTIVANRVIRRRTTAR